MPSSVLFRPVSAHTEYTTYVNYGNTLITVIHLVRAMPVDIDRFESGKLPDEPSAPEQVVTFLAGNRDKAFTRAEIAAAVDASPNAVGTALSRLKERGLVRHKGEFWAITDDEERLAAAYDLHAVSRRLDEADDGIDPDAWDAAAPDEEHPNESGDGS